MNLYETIEHLLRSNPNFIGENNEILKTKVSEAVTNLDPYLVKIFKNNDLTRQVFFQQVEDVLVLNQEKLKWVVNAKEFLEDSYTSYTNEIGLTSAGKFLSANNNVVLDFPYKDAVLVGGQDKDDQKRQEIMYHEMIGYDQITNLKAPKVFANAKRYTTDGVEENVSFTDEDNLIIKGNNYAALNSLLERYRGKVKSIIIDPPYYFYKKKSGDSFNYNSNFKLSTWLTFMKNRIEIAKKLLSEDGFLVMVMGIDGYPHIKLLMDEIFNVNDDYRNYVGTITWRKTDNQSNVGEFANVIDHVMIYRKSNLAKLNRLSLTEKAKKEYSYEDNKGKYRRANILDLTRGRYDYDIITPDKTVLHGPWMIPEDEYKEMLKNDLIHWPQKGQQIPYGKTYLKDSVENGQISSDFWDGSYGTNQRSADEIKTLFGGRVFEYAKPERLVMNLLSLTTNTNRKDIVLDLFMGSATTQAVAMKMNRRFIGIEQMDYINTVSVPRLQKVIEGEQGGISLDVNWQGGGSFVYCELLEDGQRLIDKIQSASSETIQFVKDEIYHSEQIVPYILTSDLEKADKYFNTLPLEEQKQVLIELIDKNKLYVNYSSIDDEDYQISEGDKIFSRSFYEGGEVND